MLARYALLAVAWFALVGFVPYEHDGVVVLPTADGTIEARALFSSSASGDDQAVLMRADFALPAGGEGYLTIHIPMVPVGQAAPATWNYYEKTGPQSVSFDAVEASGTVVIRDRFQTSTETSLYIEFDANFIEGSASRVFTGGYAITSPSPAVLRGSGSLPVGVVETVGAQRAGTYHRGTIDCTGSPDTVVPVGGYDYYVEEVIEEEEIIVVVDDDGSTDYDDTEYLDDEYEYDYYEDSSGFDCGGDDTTDTTTEDTSNDGPECEGDAEAAPRTSQNVWRAPLRGRRSGVGAFANRVVQLAPMLLLLSMLLLLHRPRSST
ncbi:MAG: hypothetical protein ACI9OJ_002013, partial [Myxococcota bacterium]